MTSLGYSAAFQDMIAVCDTVFHKLESLIPAPVKVPKGDDFAFRYNEHTPQIVVVQKLSRIATGLRACVALLEHGLYQEVGVMFRILDELREDVLFMCEAIRSGECSELHDQFIADFFQPEFDHDNPLLASQRRNRVPRRKIQGYLARISEMPVNPSDAQKIARLITNTHSGYVHGASEHILDMWEGHPPRYQLAGMRGTRRENEFKVSAWHYFHRSLGAFIHSAGVFGLNNLLKKLFEYRDVFEKITDKTDWESPEKLLREIKQTHT